MYPEKPKDAVLPLIIVLGHLRGGFQRTEGLVLSLRTRPSNEPLFVSVGVLLVYFDVNRGSLQVPTLMGRQVIKITKFRGSVDLEPNTRQALPIPIPLDPPALRYSLDDGQAPPTAEVGPRPRLGGLFEAGAAVAHPAAH